VAQDPIVEALRSYVLAAKYAVQETEPFSKDGLAPTATRLEHAREVMKQVDTLSSLVQRVINRRLTLTTGPSSEISRDDLGMVLRLRFGRSGAGLDTWQLDMAIAGGEASMAGVWLRPINVGSEELTSCLAQCVDDATATELVNAFRADHAELLS